MRKQSRSSDNRQQRVFEVCDLLAFLYFAARREYAIDLSHRAIRVLQFVAYREETPRIDDVARFLECATSTASELIKRLQSKGLVVRSRSDRDERVVRLELTEAGRAALIEHTSLDPKKLETGLDALPVRDQKELIRLVGEVTDRLLDRSPGSVCGYDIQPQDEA